jgi:hypothetical protein
MKVIGTSGSTTVSCEDCSISRANGMGSYPVTSSDVTLTILTEGRTITGSVNSFGDDETVPVIIELFIEGEDEDTPYRTATVFGNETGYVLENVEPGRYYLLKVSKANHVARTYRIFVQ